MAAAAARVFVVPGGNGFKRGRFGMVNVDGAAPPSSCPRPRPRGAPPLAVGAGLDHPGLPVTVSATL